MKDEVLRFRISPEDKALIAAAAEASALDMSAWARAVLVQAAREVACDEAARSPAKVPSKRKAR